MATSRVFVIFNPSAGRGRCARRMDHFLALLRRHLPDFAHARTTLAGEEEELADRALSEGYRTIVAVGGDGTWSRVADRIVRSGRDDASVALLAAGTGNDFGKTVGVTFERSEEVVRAIAEGRGRRIDVGRVAGRHFLNVVGFGFDIAVIDDAARTPILRGDALYRFCALRQLFRFPGVSLEVSDGSGPAHRETRLMLIVANAKVFGGSFRIAPRADLRDGMLDLVSIPNANPFGRARLFDLVARGRHEGVKGVEFRKSTRFRIAFVPPIRYEIDGEVHACSEPSLELEAVPRALHLLAP